MDFRAVPTLAYPDRILGGCKFNEFRQCRIGVECLWSGQARFQVIKTGFPVAGGKAPGEWSGSYRTKRLVDVGGGGEFAELAVVRVLRQEGWQAVWLDSYRRRIVFAVNIAEDDERRAFVPDGASRKS